MWCIDKPHLHHKKKNSTDVDKVSAEDDYYLEVGPSSDDMVVAAQIR